MTHKQRVLALLADGRPHTHLELYSLGCVAHSRISDLRRDGHVIEQWRDGDHYLYRLVSLGAPEAAGLRSGLTSGAPSEAPSAQSGPDPDGGHPDPAVRGSSAAERADRSPQPDDERHAGPDCGDGQLSLIATASTRGAYGEVA